MGGWNYLHGLGKHCQGRREPISVTVRSRADLQQHTGLGHKICALNYNDQEYQDHWLGDDDNTAVKKDSKKTVTFEFCKKNNLHPEFTYEPSKDNPNVGTCSLKLTLKPSETEICSNAFGPINSKTSRLRLKQHCILKMVAESND